MTQLTVRRLFQAILFSIAASLSVAHADDQSLVHEALVQAPIADVWKAFTTKEGMESWMVAHASIDLRVGGDWKTHYDPKGRIGDENGIEHTILSFVPERMFSFRTVKTPAQFPFKKAIADTWVVVTFDPVGPARTRVRVAMLGYTDDPESQRMRAFFQTGNQTVLDELVKKFSLNGSTDQDAKVMRVLGQLVGGEWIHERKTDDGKIRRARTVARRGPDGTSIVMNGWLGDESGMFYHSALQAYRRPQSMSGGIEFNNINDDGSLARGEISLLDDTTLRWHWPSTDLEGKTTIFVIEMTITANDTYRMVMNRSGPEGKLTPGLQIDFRRVPDAPEAFKKLRTPG